MGFTYVRFQHEIWSGNRRMITGTFSNSEGSEGGEIATGLHVVRAMSLQYTGSTVVNGAPTIKTTLPAPDPVEVVTAPNSCGIWISTGE
jgi:hypothetical protein